MLYMHKAYQMYYQRADRFHILSYRRSISRIICSEIDIVHAFHPCIVSLQFVSVTGVVHACQLFTCWLL